MFDKLICIIGLGYIGLPIASLFSIKGFQVYGVGVSECSVNTINKGKKVRPAPLPWINVTLPP